MLLTKGADGSFTVETLADSRQPAGQQWGQWTARLLMCFAESPVPLCAASDRGARPEPFAQSASDKIQALLPCGFHRK